MRHYLLGLAAFFLLLNFHAAGQDSTAIGTITVVKKPVQRSLPDTGRYKSPPLSWIDPGFIRCGFSSTGKSHRGEIFAGVQYFNYTYVQLGIQRTSTSFPSAAGFNLESNFDKKIFGASIFIQQRMLHIGSHFNLSAGASGSAYTSAGDIFYAATPYIALPLSYNGFDNFQLLYGYSFVFGKDLPASNQERGSLRSMNTHSFTLRYRLPFYL
jgi:hypothetical protein